MTINLHLPPRTDSLKPSITVIGVGGAGGNAVNNMIAAQLGGVNFAVANTDAQSLELSMADQRIQLGSNLTKGLGAGANPDVGKAAAQEAAEEIAETIQGSNMVFITAGMGGGTGTGAAPVVAQLAKEQGMLTVAVVTKPFQFEGTHRMRMAEAGLEELERYVDTLIIIPNQNLFRLANEHTTFADAFKMADDVLHSGVRGVTDLMVMPGLINLDFADIRAVMSEMGKAMMGTGEAEGDKRAVEAAEAAISNPLLDDMSMKGAKGVLINITGGSDMTLFEVDEAANRIREEVDSDANIIFGSAFNEELQGKMRVSVVATGIMDENGERQRVAAAGQNLRKKTFRPAAPVGGMGAKETSPQLQERKLTQAATPSPRPTVAQASMPMTEAAQQPSYNRPQPSPAPAPRPAAFSNHAPEPQAVAPESAPQHYAQESYEQHGQRASDHYADAGQAGGGTRKFFQGVARALKPAHEEVRDTRPQATQPQVRSVEPVRESVGTQEQQEYLDIPAFLRRQAN